MVYHGRKHKGRSLLLQAPCVLVEAGQASKGFMDIHMSFFPHTRWITIFEAMNSDSFYSKEGVTQFLMEDRREADIDPLSGVEPVNAPFKRPWFQSEDFQLNTGEGENLSTAR